MYSQLFKLTFLVSKQQLLTNGKHDFIQYPRKEKKLCQSIKNIIAYVLDPLRQGTYVINNLNCKVNLEIQHKSIVNCLIFLCIIFFQQNCIYFQKKQMMASQNHSNRVSNLQGQSPSFFLKSAVPMEDTMSHDLKKQSKEGQSEQVADPGDSSEISSRQEQHLLLYILNLILTFCISFQNIPLVFTSNEESKGYMSISILVVTICISMITTYNLCKDKWKIFNLYFLLDNIFLAQVASSFGFVGFLLVIYNNYWYQIITMMAFPIEIIFFVGNFRIMMLIVKWSKWKVILFKFVLLADSAVFFQIGAYYMSVNYQYTNGRLPELDGKVKDFVLLYIFGLFALFVQMYAKMCEIDQTNELRFDYELKELQQAKQIERIRKSVITLNNEEKKKTQMLGRMKRMSKVSYLEVQQMKKS